MLERGSLAVMDERPAPPELERLNHLVGLVKIWVKPPEGEVERGVPRKLAGDEGDGSGGLRLLDVDRRGAMGWGMNVSTSEGRGAREEVKECK